MKQKGQVLSHTVSISPLMFYIQAVAPARHWRFSPGDPVYGSPGLFQTSQSRYDQTTAWIPAQDFQPVIHISHAKSFRRIWQINWVFKV